MIMMIMNNRVYTSHNMQLSNISYRNTNGAPCHRVVVHGTCTRVQIPGTCTWKQCTCTRTMSMHKCFEYKSWATNGSNFVCCSNQWLNATWFYFILLSAMFLTQVDSCSLFVLILYLSLGVLESRVLGTRTRTMCTCTRTRKQCTLNISAKY